jgi:PAS domain S-box-containing protein
LHLKNSFSRNEMIPTANTQQLLDRFQHFFEPSKEILCVLDPQCRFIQVSANCIAAWGYTPEELPGKELLLMVHPEDQPTCKIHIERRKKEGGTQPFNARMCRADATYTPVRWSMLWAQEEMHWYARAETDSGPFHEYDPPGGNTRLPSLDANIATIFNVSPVAVSITSTADRKTLYVNDAFCQLLGFNHEKVISKRLTDLQIVSPESQEKVLQLVQQGGNKGQGIEVTVRKSNGDYTDVLLSIGAVEFQQQLCWITTFVDIAGQKQATSQIKVINEMLEEQVEKTTRKVMEKEKKLSRFLNSTQEGIYTLDLSYNFDLINPVGAVILEKLTGSLVHPGDNLLDIVPPERRQILQKLYMPAFKGEKLDYETPYATKTGTVWLSVHIDPLLDENNQVTGLIVSTRDISARKKAEERLQLALDAGQIGIWELNLQADTSIRNLRHDQIFGYREQLDQWGTRQFFAHVLPEDLPMVRQAMKGALTTGHLQLETRIQWPNGSTHWITATGKVVRNMDGQAITMSGTIIDITKRKRAEEALRKAIERFNLAAEASFDVIYDMNLQTNTVEVNDAIKDILGYPAGANFDVEEMRRCLHPEDKERYVTNFGAFLKSSQSYFFHEHRLNRLDGSVVYVMVRSLARRKADGTAYRVVGVLRDITEQKKAELALKESEEQYRQLFNINPLPAWVIDNETQAYLAVNDAAVKHYGYSREEFLRMHVQDLVTPGEMQRYLENVAPENRTTLTGNQGLWKYQKKDGTIVDVEIIAHSITYNHKKARLTIASDVTEKLKRELEIKNINEELHQLSSHLQNAREEERMNIAREIHDELGQALTGLKMEVLWLMKKVQSQDPELHEKARSIITLVDETVKSVRRISSSLRPSILDDLGLVAALEWYSSEVQRRSGIHVKFTSLVDTPVANTVATGLFRIYQEALTNVMRHSGARHVASELQQTAAHLVLTVKDDGQGMDHSAITSKKTLGLIGIKERTYLMGGRFTLQSYPGQGTELTISVPFELGT